MFTGPFRMTVRSNSLYQDPKGARGANKGRPSSGERPVRPSIEVKPAKVAAAQGCVWSPPTTRWSARQVRGECSLERCSVRRGRGHPGRGHSAAGPRLPVTATSDPAEADLRTIELLRHSVASGVTKSPGQSSALLKTVWW